MYLPWLRSSFLHKPSSYCLVSLPFTLHTSLSVTCKEHLVVRSALNFCLAWHLLIPPWLLKDSFARYGTRLTFFFHLALWIYLPTAFWPLEVKSVYNLIEVPCMRWFTSLLLLSTFSLFLKVWLQCVSVWVWVHLTWSLLSFLDICIHEVKWKCRPLSPVQLFPTPRTVAH